MNYGMEPPPYDPAHRPDPPEGWRRVTFTGGGSLDGDTKLVRITVSEGDDYNLIGTRETYSWDGTQFVLQHLEEESMSETTEEPTTEEPTTDTGDGNGGDEDEGGEEADGDAEPE